MPNDTPATDAAPSTTFKMYGTAFTVPNLFAAGHVMTEHEAAALSRLAAENMSHMARNQLCEDLAKGDEMPADLAKQVQNFLTETAATYAFTERTRAESSGRSGLSEAEKRARQYARVEVNKAIEAHPDFDGVQTVAQAKAGKLPERMFPRANFEKTVVATAKDPAIVAKVAEDLEREAANKVKVKVKLAA